MSGVPFAATAATNPTTAAHGGVGVDSGGGLAASYLADHAGEVGHELVGWSRLRSVDGMPADRRHDSEESVRVDVLLAGAATSAHFWKGLVDMDVHS